MFIYGIQILKPAFTILVDHKTKCFLLLIRGTHSIKDTLTAATGAVVPFHHSVVHEGGVSHCVLGYAHCGMVAAALWISKLATPCLKKALGEYPDYKLKVNATQKFSRSFPHMIKSCLKCRSTLLLFQQNHREKNNMEWEHD